jgi:hypothetical protein
VECKLQQSGAVVAGTCKGDTFPEAKASGSVDQDNVQFSFILLFAEQQYPCTYKGKLLGNGELQGSILITGIDGVNGEFRAKKQ